MVVLKPYFKGEEERQCPCGHIGLRSPIRERTSFYRQGKSFRTRCRKCSVRAAQDWVDAHSNIVEKKRKAAWQQRKTQMTPEEREKAQRYHHEYYLRRKDDPELRARKVESDRRFHKRHKQRLAEDRHIRYRLKREEEGKWKPPPAEGAKSYRTGKMLPVWPVAKWIEGLITTAEKRLRLSGEVLVEDIPGRAVDEVANALVCEPRQFWRIRKREYDNLDIGTVDALTTNGGTTIDKVYQEYGNIVIGLDWSWAQSDLH